MVPQGMGRRALVHRWLLMLIVMLASLVGAAPVLATSIVTSGTSGSAVGVGQLPLVAGPVLNVQALGATSDGTTDDTAAFQSGLQTLVRDGGGTLLVPAGTYRVDPGVLTVGSHVAVVGFGATLEPANPGYELLDVQGTEITVAGLTLAGQGAVVRGMSVEAGSADVVLFHDTVSDVTQPADPASPFFTAMPVGLQIYGDTHAILVAGMSIDQVVAVRPECAGCTAVARGILITATGSQTIGQDITVAESTIENVGPKDDGDCLVAQNGTTAANLVIRNNSFTGCAKRAIKLQVSGVLVAGNTIDNPFLGDNAGLSPAYSYANFPYDMYAAISIYANDVTVTGNTIGGIGSFYNGIELGSPCEALRGVNVIDNTVRMGATSYTTGASLIRAMSPVTGLVITGNQGSYADYGITLPPNLTAQLADNTFSNVTSPLHYYQTPCS